MRFPAVLYVGHTTYRVKRSNEGVDSDDTRTHMGHTDHINQAIHINPDLMDEQARSTLWHEALHCAFYAYLGQPDWRRLGADQSEREEAVVRRIEYPILDLLRKNPGLLIALVDGEDADL